MSLQRLPNKDKLASILTTAAKNSESYAKEWSPAGQFKGKPQYTMDAIYSRTTTAVTGNTTSGSFTWELDGDAIYDGLTFELSYGAFTQNHAGDTIMWDTPIKRIELFHGGNSLGKLNYRDYVTSFKCADSDYRIGQRRYNCFVDTLTGSQPAFTQTIDILGMKNYGFSENASKAHITIPVPTIDKLQIEITFRNQFTITDGGAGLADAPLITSSRMMGMKRLYYDKALFVRDQKALLTSGNSLRPISVYSSVSSVNGEPFTTDAAGEYDDLDVALTSIEKNFVSFFLIRVRLATAAKETLDSVPFTFRGKGNTINKNSSPFRQLYTSSVCQKTFSHSHRGRVPSSDYDTATVLDGEMVLLSSEASIFELEDIQPDYYEGSCGPQLIIEKIGGLAAATNYVLDVYAVLMDALVAGL